MKPTDVVRTWVERFNEADANGLCELYDQNAINHQVVTEPLVGLEAIREMFEIEFSRAKMVCTIENLFEDGKWAILKWSDPLGLRGCGLFHIRDGKIVFQRGYFDQLTFFRIQRFDIPDEYLNT